MFSISHERLQSFDQDGSFYHTLTPIAAARKDSNVVLITSIE